MGNGSSGNMAIEAVTGIAILSGKGGVGKSVISLNLALSLGSLGVKTLLFDAACGDLINLANLGYPDAGIDKSRLYNLTDNVDLNSPAARDSYSVHDESDLEDFLAEIARFASGYRCVIFDCPSGTGPIAYMLAGLSEMSIIISTPDPTSIAGAYLLAKSLYFDGLARRCGILFNQVDSADQAASLQTKFNLLTRQFLHHEFEHVGHIHSDIRLAESVLEQQPLLLESTKSGSSIDIINLAEKLCQNSGFQFETGDLKSHSGQ